MSRAANTPPIYGIMITGKDASRIKLARLAVRNFREQRYAGPKHLLIINHHPWLRVMGKQRDARATTEVVVDRNRTGITLGAMRNLALSRVPVGALWTTWDDDDYRSPHYLATLNATMRRRGVSAVSFMHRLEFNANTGFSWKVSLRHGFVTPLAVRLAGVPAPYLDLDTLEDARLREHYPDMHVINNARRFMYLRLVHQNNTSVFVHASKSRTTDHVPVTRRAVYRETDTTPAERRLVAKIMAQHYAMKLCSRALRV